MITIYTFLQFTNGRFNIFSYISLLLTIILIYTPYYILSKVENQDEEKKEFIYEKGVKEVFMPFKR